MSLTSPISPKKSFSGRVSRFFKSLLPGSSAPPIEVGLQRLNARLGFRGDTTSPTERQLTSISVHRTEEVARAIYYAPDMDGQPEAGEVVWMWAPSDGPGEPLRDRAILVVGNNRHTVLGLVISPNPEHARDENWLDIGAGEWDSAGRPCWLRLDRVVEISQLGIRRQGVFFPPLRFERVVTKLRSQYSWT